MFVVEHEPYTYFLLRDGDDLYLDANCDHGAVGYSVLIQMNDEEVKHYVENGKAYVRDLAVSIHNNVPILRPGSKCLVSCDHIPRRSWPLFRAKAMLGDLIAGFSSPGNQSHQEQFAA